MLKHLILSPQNGLCNRLRAIASARRICHRLSARCSVIWDWGDFWQFFAPLPDVRIVRLAPRCTPGEKRMHNFAYRQRFIDVRAATVRVRSGLAFWGSDEQPIRSTHLTEYYPRPHVRLQETIERFAASHLRQAVGMHIRRTDNEKSIRLSPDRLFLDEASRIVAADKRIFLATDNLETEAMMVREFGTAIVTHPRRQLLEERWPRPEFDPIALEDDLVDLFLLSRTQYVLGSRWSSFSGLAMALNGSPLCRKLGEEAGSLDESL